MPRYRVSGDIRHAFVHEVEADSIEKAEEFVAGMNHKDLDNVDTKPSTTAIEVDNIEEIES